MAQFVGKFSQRYLQTLHSVFYVCVCSLVSLAFCCPRLSTQNILTLVCFTTIWYSAAFTFALGNLRHGHGVFCIHSRPQGKRTRPISSLLDGSNAFLYLSTVVNSESFVISQSGRDKGSRLSLCLLHS